MRILTPQLSPIRGFVGGPEHLAWLRASFEVEGFTSLNKLRESEQEMGIGILRIDQQYQVQGA